MRRCNFLISRMILFGFAVAMVSLSRIHAGEAVSEKDELDNGPSFFGEAKEVGTLRPMQNVQIRAEVGEQRISTYTNDEGSFKIPGLGKETVADSVAITCSKQGYRTLDMSRRRLSNAADAPVVIECLLEPAP
jgi:hypothetical protein